MRDRIVRGFPIAADVAQWAVVRFHTPAVVLMVAACGSGPGGSKSVPVEPPQKPSTVQVIADAAIDAPDPPKLACENDTTPTPGPAPEPTWYCVRPDGTRHGPFITLFPDNTIEISGTYKDGTLDGPWERHHAVTAAIIEQGAYANGQKHGKWRQSNPQGSVIGEYEMVSGTGVEKRWYEDGPLYSETALKAGVLHGAAKVYLHDGGLIANARHVKGKLHGPRAFGTKSSMRFEETFAGGVRRGPRKIWNQGLIIEETYDRRGRLDGPFTVTRTNKLPRVQGEYLSGKRTGDWVWHDRDGKKEREGSYVDGKRDGDWLEWVDDKLMFSGTYSLGRPNGTFTYFTKTGTELGKFDIKDGTGWMLTFHTNGKPWSKQWLYKGVEGGTFQILTRLGKPLLEGHYAGGVKHGVWKEWNADGVLLLEKTWKRGKLEGVVKKYVGGKLAMQATYVAGKAEGPYIEYRLEQPSVTGQFADDRKTGTWTSYGPDGAVVVTATYNAGVLDGPWRELVGGVVLEGEMVAGRRSGTWTRTDKVGGVRKLTYRTP
jgi:antitoxin component YwqK of YwqJK toxin-antitoxin module